MIWALWPVRTWSRYALAGSNPAHTVFLQQLMFLLGKIFALLATVE